MCHCWAEAFGAMWGSPSPLISAVLTVGTRAEMEPKEPQWAGSRAGPLQTCGTARASSGCGSHSLLVTAAQVSTPCHVSDHCSSQSQRQSSKKLVFLKGSILFHSFIQQVFVEHLLSARLWMKPGRYSSSRNKKPCPQLA